MKREGKLAWPTALSYTISILSGLSHAHSFNIVHRDIKPSNIVVNGAHSLKILDFNVPKYQNIQSFLKY
ncbi:MAG: protein kinase domain-containing protein [Candidatus Fonsibacter sp.]